MKGLFLIPLLLLVTLSVSARGGEEGSSAAAGWIQSVVATVAS